MMPVLYISGLLLPNATWWVLPPICCILFPTLRMSSSVEEAGRVQEGGGG